jgi:hypothetical protein
VDSFRVLPFAAWLRPAAAFALTFALLVVSTARVGAQSFSKVPSAYADAGPTIDLPPPPQLGPVDHLAPRLYGANENDSVVDTLSQREPYRTIGSIYGFLFPDAVAVGPNGDVIVADEITYVVSVFGPNAISPKYAFQSSGPPIDVAVGPHGDIYLSLYEGTGAPGYIAVYKPGAKQPYATISSQQLQLFYFMTLDRAGNLYADGLASSNGDQGPGIVGMVKAGTTTVRLLPMQVGFPGGVALDRRGNLLICDQLPDGHLGSVLDVFAPGASKPSRSFTIGPNGADVLTFALAAGGDGLFTADVTNGASEVYSYPGGKLLDAVRIPGGKGQRPGYGVVSVATWPPVF